MILQNFNIKITSRFQALNLNLIKTKQLINWLNMQLSFQNQNNQMYTKF